jgi:DNA-binding GntR family transcriptional regulator
MTRLIVNSTKASTATHNDFLAEQTMAVRTRLSAFRRTQLRQGNRIVRSRDEHDGVMEAISHGDGELAQWMRAHMLNAASALDRYIAAHDGEAPGRTSEE